MQIKTNIRAGSGSSGGGSTAKHSGIDNTPVATPAPPPPPVVYVPPVGRCVGY